MIRGPEPLCDLKLGALNRTRPRYKQQLGQRLPRCRARKKSVQRIIYHCLCRSASLTRQNDWPGNLSLSLCLVQFNCSPVARNTMLWCDALLKHGNILVPGKSCEVFVFSLLDRKWNRRDTKLRRGFSVNLSTFSYYVLYSQTSRQTSPAKLCQQTVAGYLCLTNNVLSVINYMKRHAHRDKPGKTWTMNKNKHYNRSSWLYSARILAEQLITGILDLQSWWLVSPHRGYDDI